MRGRRARYKQGLKTCFGERERSEKAGASGADNDRAFFEVRRRRGGNEGSSSSIAAYARAVTLGNALSTASRSRWGLVSLNTKAQDKNGRLFLRASIDLRWEFDGLDLGVLAT